ncbi:flotillin-1 isoform X1 [Hydra vulgaris]|uniref:flotillin-1 isoform X1 n=1 Tax=Hydra vulgaris TaxID=6087 RepID=UPI0001927449|nr:flotillin-1 [Hydra vulgaris]
MGFETCGPNEAMVVSGCGQERPLLISGGRKFVWAGLQKVQKISLNVMTLNVESPRVYTLHGVPISVTGIAQVKVQGSNEEMLHAACQQFLGKTEAQISKIALETLEGHQRAIMGTMTVEEIYQDRKKFSSSVFEVATSDLVHMGIQVISYTLKDVRDEEGYLLALGQKRIAEVQTDARIGQAQAKMQSGIREAEAEEIRVKAEYENHTEVARSQRDFQLKKASYDIEINAKKAIAELSSDLQTAITKQKIKEAEMDVKVIERAQAINVQIQEIQRKEKELESQVKIPANAEKYKIEKIAEAHRAKVILEAEAEAESIRIRGEAEAYAIEVKARAEAEQMSKKAAAWKEYQDAAMVDMLLETLPKVAAEIAHPLSKVKKMTMISSGSKDIGASKITGELLDIVIRMPQAMEQLTGVDITKIFRKS